MPTTSADSAPDQDLQRAEGLRNAFQKIRQEVAKIVVGQDEIIEQLLIAMLARGHCLLEGVPGLAKTLMVRSLANAMDLQFQRIQFTPDLMPADITGTDIIQESTETGRRELVFQKGPVFTQILLADEINRTPPKTQAALLEAMQEHGVTVGGKTYRLTEPFFVLATQNPIEQEGTYPLPEAQRDRFLFHVMVSYPSREEEGTIIDRTTSNSICELAPVVTGKELLSFQQTVRLVPLAEHVKNYVLDLVRALRPGELGTSAESSRSNAKTSHPWVKQYVQWGPGPRASQQLVLAAKVRAILQGRYHVTIDDIQFLARPVLRHRLVPTFSAEAEGLTTDALIQRLLKELPKKPSRIV